MSNHLRPPRCLKARKEHICIYCGGPIPYGEQHIEQTGYWEGKAFRNRYHDECFENLINEYGVDEFQPYTADYPERIQALVDRRNCTTTDDKD